MRTVTALLFCALAVSSAACKSKGAPPTAAQAAPSATPIARGDRAPDFRLEGSDGKTHTLADHVGKQAVVIAWFPKAFTGG
jgi:peroxiredoxin Q/BCP